MSSSVTSFPEGLRIYKPLEDVSTPLLSEDDGTIVVFSVIAAHQDPVVYTWLLGGSDRDTRLDSRGPLAEVTPILLSSELDTTSSLMVEVSLSTTPPTTQTANLFLQSRPNCVENVSLSLSLSLSTAHLIPHVPAPPQGQPPSRLLQKT